MILNFLLSYHQKSTQLISLANKDNKLEILGTKHNKSVSFKAKQNHKELEMLPLIESHQTQIIQIILIFNKE